MTRSGKISFVKNILRFSLSLFLFLCFAISARAEWRTLGSYSRVAETKPNDVVPETTARQSLH